MQRRKSMSIRIRAIPFILAGFFALALPQPSFAQQAPPMQQVSFASLPLAVQTTLVQHAGNLDFVRNATVWTSFQGGRRLYTGQLIELDGSAQMITVDDLGNLIEVARRPAEAMLLTR
jgi:hypothetical protein